MAEEFRFYGGGEPEDPMAAFARFADELGLRSARVGMEVPGGYLQPPHYVALKAMLGDALVQDGIGVCVSGIAGGEVAGGTGLMFAGPRRSRRWRWQALIGAVAEGRSELELGGGSVSCAVEQWQRIAGQHDEPDDRGAQRLRSRRSDRTRALRRR